MVTCSKTKLQRHASIKKHQENMKTLTSQSSVRQLFYQATRAKEYTASMEVK